MTVAELIATLQALPADQKNLPIAIAYQAGDYWHTTVAPQVKAARRAHVEPSEYHGKPVLVEDEERDGDETIILTA